MWHLEHGLVLSKDHKLTTISGADIALEHLGTQYSDDVYFSVSQGLLDVQMLGSIDNPLALQDLILAPSYLTREATQIQDFLDLQNLAKKNLTSKKPFNSPASSPWHITDENI